MVSKKYLTMIHGIKEGGTPEWSVYVVWCGDRSLYTGIAKDVEARLKQHNAGKGAAYTRTHLPVRLAFFETNLTRSEALIREAEIKRMSRRKKERLIAERSVTRSRICDGTNA